MLKALIYIAECLFCIITYFLSLHQTKKVRKYKNPVLTRNNPFSPSKAEKNNYKSSFLLL